MFIKSAFSFVALCALASLGVAACSATTDDASEDPTSEVQDQELRKSITACSTDADCVAVPRGGCCSNGYNEAVNKHHTQAYASATKCALHPHPMCPMFLVHDTRVAQCDGAKKQCAMVAIDDIKCGGFIQNAHQCPTGYSCSHVGVNPDVGGKCVNDSAAVLGSWGATGAIMTISDGQGDIEFGCGRASIDAFTFSNPTTFTATGTHTAGTGVQPPPGHEPTPQPATFTGHVSGNKLTLTMTVGGNTSTLTFTKDRQINLVRCL
jgi:hypothetical protein